MAREGIPTWFYVLVVVRFGRRFLLVRERSHGQDWYLPAGRVEFGETLAEAARRETLEEGGLPIVLEGVLRVEHTPQPYGTRLRVFFVARPEDDTPPKTTEGEHSLCAEWVTLDELDEYTLRSHEVREALEYVSRGEAVYPLSVLGREGTAWKRE